MKLNEENTGTLFIFTILFLLSGSLNFFFIVVYLDPHPWHAQLIEGILVLVTGLIAITCLVIVVRTIVRLLDEERDAQKNGTYEERLKRIEKALAGKET
jgi:heme/copper-type cytochrome/quinol oxidase subunit 2